MGFRLDLQAFALLVPIIALLSGYYTKVSILLQGAGLFYFMRQQCFGVKSQYWLTFHGQSDILNIVNKGVNALKGMIL